jgi:RNA polymerase I-specific transcription initiation factor RRN7
MEDNRELHRFPRGETCPECPARRWYSEGGFRYCQNGHQIEVSIAALIIDNGVSYILTNRQGYVQYDAGHQEADSQVQRARSTKKQAREKERRVLSGRAASDLFLECLQLLLRSQLLWMVKEKGIKDELETIVRDLWDLRIRGDRAVEETSSEGELMMISSQAASGSETDQSSSSRYSRRSKTQSWDSNPTGRWPLPRLQDSLVLCYLGCLLLRLPIRIGDICKWASDEDMPYRRAVGSGYFQKWRVSDATVVGKLSERNARTTADLLRQVIQSSPAAQTRRCRTPRSSATDDSVLLPQLRAITSADELYLDAGAIRL